MATGDVIALNNESGTEVFAVDQSGNLAVQGTLAAALGLAAGLHRFGVTTVAMNDAAHALVLGTAGAAETKLTGNLVFADAESSGTETLTLPPEADSEGLMLVILNTGGESITVASDAPATVVTVATAEAAVVACDGTTWYGLVGANT